MTVTTGMLMAGKMSTDIVRIAAMPRTAINRARTTNVYGRRSASRTIHILVAFGDARATARTRWQQFEQESATRSRADCSGFLLKSLGDTLDPACTQHLEK